MLILLKVISGMTHEMQDKNLIWWIVHVQLNNWICPINMLHLLYLIRHVCMSTQGLEEWLSDLVRLHDLFAVGHDSICVTLSVLL